MTVREILRLHKDDNKSFSVWNVLNQYCEFAGDYDDYLSDRFSNTYDNMVVNRIHENETTFVIDCVC